MVKKSFKRACWLYKLPVLLLLFFANAHAADFIVLSNADSGPGTLRAALTAAAANGDVLPDRILFSLPGTTEADFTILIGSQLPDVSSNLVIDGTSQPGNKIAGTINTHVVIKSVIQPHNDFAIFKGDGVHDVEFYGLLMWDTNLVGSSGPDSPTRYGISVTNAKRITVGKAGKGNWFDGYNQESIAMTDCRTVTILGNTFHKRAGNNSPDDTAPIYLKRIVDLNFGDAGAGNVVFTTVFISLANTTEESKIVFVDNNFAVEADGKTTTLRGKAGVKIIGGDINPTDPNALVDILFTGNIFTHYDESGIKLDFLKGKAVIKHNWFGTDRGGTLPLNYNRNPDAGRGIGVAISRFLGDVQVGDKDPAQANLFANSEYGVTMSSTTNLLLMRNSFHCIEKNEYDSGYDQIPSTTVTSFTTSAINGTATPGAIVDLFSTDECNIRCSPDKLIATILADVGGLWQYAFIQPAAGYVTANSHVGKKSSNFAQIIINVDSIKVTDAICGKLGSIKNVRVSNTTSVKWVNRDGKVVSRSLDLVNVPPGGYKLIAGDFCTSETYFYDIQDFNVRVNDAYRKIQQPSCGLKDGSIMGLIIVNQNYFDPVSYCWVDSLQKTVSTSLDLNNVGAGIYTLKLTTLSGCETSYGPFTLANAGNLLLHANATTAIITPDDCGAATGGVNGIGISGGTPPYTFKWTDALGRVAGNQQSLTSAKAGTYTLTITDAAKSACNIATLSFNIPARDVTLPAPAAPSMNVCGPTAVQLRVTNAGKGVYKLYNSATATMPLQQNNMGVFNVTVTANTTYYISFETGTCSSSRAPVNVRLAGPAISIPSTFTPNGDTVNDTWEIANLAEYSNATIRIYNRNGLEVFFSRGYQRPFAGKKNNLDLPVGTYYYLIDLGTGCNPLSGSVTIVR